MAKKTKKDVTVSAEVKEAPAAEVKTEEAAAPEVKTESNKVTAENTEVKKEAVKKPAEKKATAEKKTAKADKPVEKKAEKAEKAKDKIVIQFAGKEFDSEEIVEKCKSAYKAENSRKTIRSIDVYIKPEENKAYYVINGKAEGLSIEL